MIHAHLGVGSLRAPPRARSGAAAPVARWGNPAKLQNTSLGRQQRAYRPSELFNHATWFPRDCGRTPTVCLALGGGDTGGGSSGGAGGSGGGGDWGDYEEESFDDEEDDELLTITKVESAAIKAGVSIPSDMVEIAKTEGIRAEILSKFIEYRKLALIGGLMGSYPFLRDRVLADDRFLFKMGTEIFIDTGCATFAEFRKRAEDFWGEFEFYISDLLIGVVLDATLVTLMASRATLGQYSLFTRLSKKKNRGVLAALQRALASLPANVFARAQPGEKFTVAQRALSYGYKVFEYGSVGMVCGLVGQAVANTAMLTRRALRPPDPDDDIVVSIPPLVKTAMVWGLFMGVSANTRYQIVVGLERAVESLPLASRLPIIANVATVVIRFANNIYGGENFVDLARWAGVQGGPADEY